MPAMYNYSKARQSLATLLEQAAKEGEVKIRRKDGQVFVIRPEPRKDSPLDVEGISLHISSDEVVQIVREGRETRTSCANSEELAAEPMNCPGPW
jgi:antitoxin Phd